MGLLNRFESRLEQAVSGVFARAFRSEVQPVELAAALQREVDNNAQILSRDRRIVPNTFTVELSTMDFGRLSPYEQTLTGELSDLLREHAGEQHYVFAGPIAVTFTEETELSTGRFRVRSEAQANVTAARKPSPQPRGPDRSAARSGRPTQPGVGPRVETRIEASLSVHGQTHPLLPPGLLVGRGSEADLRIEDPGVSRRHAEFRISEDRGEEFVEVVDLGSTNGTRVQGRRVDSLRLTDGSQVRVGNTEITVRIDPQPTRPAPGDRTRDR